MLKVIGFRGGRTFRILWLLEELGLPYEFEKHSPQSDMVSTLNPLRQVPVVIDGEDVLTDSLAIAYLLTDRAGRLTYPPGSTDRARMDARINFAITELEAPCWMASRHSFVLPEERRHPELKPILALDFADAERKFATLIGDDPFFAGGEFTVADIVAGHCVSWGDAQGFGHKTPQMADYFERMKARPAWVRARAE